MTAFNELVFSPQDFSRITGITHDQYKLLEKAGWINTIRRKMGNVDRKMITLEELQEFHRKIRTPQSALVNRPSDDLSPVDDGRHGDQPIIDIEKIFNEQLRSGAVSHKTQMFYNIKGGTGKSTLTAQFVMRAAMMGYRVLAVDLDGQGHLSLNLDVIDAHEKPTVYDILINEFPIQESIVNVAPCLDLIPANLGLCNIEIPLNQKPRREYRLSEAIDLVKDQYDLIVADTNPAASILNCSMLVASDAVNVVCATNPLSFHGMSLVMSTLEEMEREFRKALAIRIIPNMYDNREVISQEVLGELRSQFPNYCTESVVHKTADLNESTKRRTAVSDVNSRGTATYDVNQMTLELIYGPQANQEVAPHAEESLEEVSSTETLETSPESSLESDQNLTEEVSPNTQPSTPMES